MPLAGISHRNMAQSSYVTEAIQALQSSQVYIYPGTPGTDYNTESQLKMFVSSSDNIVLVMLPVDALQGTDILTIAKEISAGLDDQKTIGLAVGRKLIGFSKILPDTVAGEKMERAESVSNDTVTALITFTQNIHGWMTENGVPTPSSTPLPTSTPKPTSVPIKLPNTKDVSLPAWVVGIGLFFAGVVILSIFIKKMRDKRKYESLMKDLR